MSNVVPTTESVQAPAHSGMGEHRLARLLTLIALGIGLFISLSVPAGYFHLAHEAQTKESEVLARLHAAFVSLAIANTQGDWRTEVVGLISAELSSSKWPEERLLLDAKGALVDRSGEHFNNHWVVTSQAAVNHIDGVVGQVKVRRSLVPIMISTFWVALGSIFIGLAIYACLRVLPLRALSRTLAALRHTEGRARVEAEANLSIVFRKALDGIVISDAQGRITSCNLSASLMIGQSEEALRGQQLSTLIPPVAGLQNKSPSLHRQYETVIYKGDGELLAVDVAMSESSSMGQVRRIAIIRDITERHQAQARLLHLANYDSLTGLPNRSLFRDRLAGAVQRSKERQQMAALMFLDLDRFKTINDSLGHDFGDKLLQQVSISLNSCLRQSDFVTTYSDRDDDVGVYRLGGDEFTVLVEALPHLDDAHAIAKRILRSLSQPFQVGVHQIFISASIGITLLPQYSDDLDILIKQADLAMYRSKSLGRDTYTFFSADLEEVVAEQHAIQTSLHHALEREEFSLVYQPKADLKTGRITGVEALLRWNQPSGQQVAPDKFIPILEETGLIVQVGMWAIREACEQLMRWRAYGVLNLTVAVNLSARQFRQEDLIEQIRSILHETKVPRGFLEIELTESSLVEDSDAVVEIMKAFRDMGVEVAVDDFGTGHSSLRYLKRFDVSTLKIDRSFVQDTPHDHEDNAIAIAVIALGHGLGLKVVAEGVENEAQRAFLRRHGCDEIQGFLLSKPLAAEAFQDWLMRREVEGAAGSDHALNTRSLEALIA